MIEYIYSALHSPFGIVLECDEPERLRQQLYTARRELQDEDLKGLSFVSSPTSEIQIWIVKNEKKRGDPTPESNPLLVRGPI